MSKKSLPSIEGDKSSRPVINDPVGVQAPKTSSNDTNFGKKKNKKGYVVHFDDFDNDYLESPNQSNFKELGILGDKSEYTGMSKHEQHESICLRLLKSITENVVDMKQFKQEKSISKHKDQLDNVYASEANFFSQGKFLPFARAYVNSGFNKNYKPKYFIEITFRERSDATKPILKSLRDQKFKVRPIKNDTPDVHKYLTIDEVRSLFENRNNSPYGAYQPSRNGFRSSRQENWNEQGMGFSLFCIGMDDRKNREEYHIIDDEEDMKEVADMEAFIRRSLLKMKNQKT